VTFPALYAIVVGVLMIGQWAFFLGSGQVPELKTEPVRVRFHIAAEMITAAGLIITGAGLLAAATWATSLYPVAIGMLLYTVIVSPGYFAERKVWPIVAMFAVLFVLSLLSLAVFVQAA
jgi:hypothetical protein